MRLALLAVLVTILWDPVDRDCKGGLEAIPPVYAVWTYTAVIIGYAPGPDGEPLPVYQRTGPREELTPDTSFPLPDPPPGGVLAWRDPVAVSFEGNRSDQPCE